MVALDKLSTLLKPSLVAFIFRANNSNYYICLEHCGNFYEMDTGQGGDSADGSPCNSGSHYSSPGDNGTECNIGSSAVKNNIYACRWRGKYRGA